MPTFCNISVVSQRYKIVASKLMFVASVFLFLYNREISYNLSA